MHFIFKLKDYHLPHSLLHNSLAGSQNVWVSLTKHLLTVLPKAF